jgi:hypothetical protein
MNNTKKIITLAVILGLTVLSFILFGSKLGANTTTASSVMSKVDSAMSKTGDAMSSAMSSAIVTKDNKTIELLPKDQTQWTVTEAKFDATTSLPPGYAGINGAKVFYNPPAGGSNMYTYRVVNSTFPMSEGSKTEFAIFKDIMMRNNNSTNDDFFRAQGIFRDTNYGGGFAIRYIKDVPYTKPANLDSLRVFVSKDGNGGIPEPVVNLLGKRGNDYFYMEKLLDDIKIKDLYAAAQAACNNSNVDNCIENKYQASLDPLLTNEYIKTEVDESLAMLN